MISNLLLWQSFNILFVTEFLSTFPSVKIFKVKIGKIRAKFKVFSLKTRLRRKSLLICVITTLKLFLPTKLRENYTVWAINDPLGQTHSPASSDHYSHLIVVLFCEILKSGDWQTDGQAPRAKKVITTGRPRRSKDTVFAESNQTTKFYVSAKQDRPSWKCFLIF